MCRRRWLSPADSDALTVSGVAQLATDDIDTRQVIRHVRARAADAASEADDSQRRALQPSTWGPFDIIREIGRGGYGTVYLAWESTLERAVALKLLHDADRSSAALNEGRLLALAEHPNVVRVLGADEHDGVVGLWMEFVKGITLREFLEKNGPLGAHEASAIGICLCQAVAAVHWAGLVHRDIKVHNVMREDGTGRIVLMDFGSGAIRTDDLNDLSDVVGTPLYLAPELLTGSPATIVSDVYSLGVVLYHLVTLDFPVRDESTVGGCKTHSTGPIVPLTDRRPDVPVPFAYIVSRALSLDPAQRYETVGAMQQDLIRGIGLDLRAAISLS
jgi:serine/threonine protein kinase